jgi:hypothetical protein
MDPNANLTEQLSLAQKIVDGRYAIHDSLEADADRLAELVVALDGWIRGGGFLPAAWEKGRTQKRKGDHADDE